MKATHRRNSYTREWLRLPGVGFGNLKAHPQCHIFSSKDPPPNPSQKIPLTEAQAFKHRSLWGPFSFKALHLGWVLNITWCTMLGTERPIMALCARRPVPQSVHHFNSHLYMKGRNMFYLGGKHSTQH